MSVYTRRLGTLNHPGPGWVEIYRAPSAGTVVVRDLVVVNATTAIVGEMAMRFRPLTKAGEVWLWYSKDVAIGTTHVDVRQVIAPGESLEAYSPVPGVYFLATGYVFS